MKQIMKRRPALRKYNEIKERKQLIRQFAIHWNKSQTSKFALSSIKSSMKYEVLKMK